MRLLIVTTVAFIVFVLYLTIREESQWQLYAGQHCKVIGTMSASTGVGVTGNGSVATTFIPEKTGYLCDDGQQYWR